MNDEMLKEIAAEATTRHLEHAHGVILRQRVTLRTLNEVLKRRKYTVRRLRMYVTAVRALHSPMFIETEDEPPESYTICKECCCDGGMNQTERCAEEHAGDCWPCRTFNAVGTMVSQLVPLDESDTEPESA